MEPSCITQPVGLFTQPNPANGDCLFASIAQALNAYAGTRREELAKHLDFLHLKAGEVTSTQLRGLVYVLFLVSNPEVDTVIDAWRMVRAASPELSYEYAQARVLPPDTAAATLSVRQRIQFFNACMDTRLCWGEETALEFLERLLGIRCLVIVNKKLQTRSFHAVTSSKGTETKAAAAATCATEEKTTENTVHARPLLYIPLSLCDVHYQSVVWEDAEGDEHAAFAEEELPDILLFLSQRDCDMVEVPCINLRHRIAARGLQAGEETVKPGFTFDTELVQHFIACKKVYADNS